MTLNLQSPSETSSGIPPWMQAGGAGLSAEIFDSEDMQKCRLVWDLLQKAKKFRANWDKNWDRFWLLWEGEQWKKQRPQSLHQAVVNQVFASVETVIGHAAKNIPPVQARSRSPKGKPTSEIVTKLLLYTDEQNSYRSEAEQTHRAAGVTGVGWWRVDWDETASDNKGDVVYRPVDEKFMFVSPHARNLKEASFVIEARNVPREHVVKTFERGHLVPPGVWDGSLSNVRVTGGVDRLWDTAAAFTTTDGSATQMTFASGQQGRGGKDQVTLIEAWIRQDDGDIRWLVVSNGIVLQDGPSPYDDREFPYVHQNLIPVMDSIYGRSLVQFIERLQDELNQIHSYALDQQEFASNNPLVVDIANVEEGDLVTNEPGAIFINQNPNGVGYYPLQMGGASMQWLQMQELVRNMMDEVLGHTDVLKGEMPSGVNTLGGLEIIREEANVRLFKMVEHVKASKRRLSMLALNRIRQFMTSPRVFRITGKGGQDEFVELNQVTGFDMTGSPILRNAIPEDVQFDIDFEHASPGGRQAEIELALALSNAMSADGLPMVDRRFVLEKALEDGAEVQEVLARMDQMGAAKAQAEAKAAQTQAGAPVPEEESEEEMMSNALSILEGQGE